MPIISREIFIEFSYQFLRSLPILTEIISYVNQHRATSHKEEVPDRAMVTKDEIIYNLLICHNYASTISESIFRSELPIAFVSNKQLKTITDISVRKILFTINIFYKRLLNPEFLLVVRMRSIQRCGRIMAGNAVLGDQSCDICIGIAIEQAVVAHTEADDHIEICLCLI